MLISGLIGRWSIQEIEAYIVSRVHGDSPPTNFFFSLLAPPSSLSPLPSPVFALRKLLALTLQLIDNDHTNRFPALSPRSPSAPNQRRSGTQSSSSSGEPHAPKDRSWASFQPKTTASCCCFVSGFQSTALDRCHKPPRHLRITNGKSLKQRSCGASCRNRNPSTIPMPLPRSRVAVRAMVRHHNRTISDARWVQHHEVCASRSIQTSIYCDSSVYMIHVSAHFLSLPN